MSTLSYAEFQDAIARASALELAGIIHLAMSKLRSLDAAPIEPQFHIPAQVLPTSDGPRDRKISIYLAGCTGLKLRSKVVGRPIYKIGTTTRCDVDGRVNDLSKVRYAGYDPNTKGHRDGFDDYARIAFKDKGQALPPGMLLSDGCFALELPPHLSRSQFESRFRQVLAPHSVSEWAQTGPAKALLSARSVDGAQLPTLTGFPYGKVRAKELYVLSIAQTTTIVADAAAAVCGGRR